MQLTVHLPLLSVKNTKVEKYEVPNLARSKNMIPNMIRIVKVVNGGDQMPANEINFKFWSGGVDIFEYKESYFQLNNIVNLDDYKSYMNAGKTCEFTLRCFNEVPCEYRVIIDYIESLGNVFYQDKLMSLKNVFIDIKNLGYMTKLTLIFADKIKNLKLASYIGNLNLDETEPWFYPIEFEDEEDGNYTIDFTKENRIYVDFAQFLQFSYEYNDKDVKESNILVLAQGYDN